MIIPVLCLLDSLEKMEKSWLKVLLIMTIMFFSAPLATSDRFYIRTSPTEPCPAEYEPSSCMTLQQYINETNSSSPYNSTTSLELQSGTHTITSNISASNVTLFNMYGRNAGIVCSQESSGVALEMRQITLVNISGVHFTNCRAAYFRSVATLTIQDCLFQDHGPVILHSTNTTITNTTFLNGRSLMNSTTDMYSSAGTLCIFGNDTQLHITSSTFSGYSGGGGLIQQTGYRAAITLNESRFSNNSADQCTVLQLTNSFNSTILLLKSSFTQNRADRSSFSSISNSTGGVVCASGASVIVYRSTFHQNRASEDAGVLQIENSILSVMASIFTKNRAGRNGGIIYTAFSQVSATITDSHFENNMAGGDGGVIYMGRNGSSLVLQRSSFTSNAATGRGGVIAMVGSELNIIQTSFYNNTATVGDIISACGGSVTDDDNLVVPQADPNNTSCTAYDNPNVQVPQTNVTNNVTEDQNTSTPITSYITTVYTPESNETSTPYTEPPTLSNTTTVTEDQNMTSTAAFTDNAFTTTNNPETAETHTTSTEVPMSPTNTSTANTQNQNTTPTASNESEQFTQSGVVYAALGIAIGVCVLVLILYIIVICIIMYLCRAFKSKERIDRVNNPYVYVPMNENENNPNEETPS